MSQKNSWHHYHKTFIIMVVFSFLLAVLFAIIFKLMFDQIDAMQYQVLRLEKKVQNLSEQSILPVGNQDSVSEDLPPRLVINESLKSDIAWLRKDLKTLGVQFFYPSNYIVSGDESLLYVSPEPKVSNETPLPVATIRKIPNKTGQSLENFVRGYFNGTAYHMADIEILNGMTSVMVTFDDVSDEFGTCGRYILSINDTSFLEIAPYECHEWDLFETLVKSITQK